MWLAFTISGCDSSTTQPELLAGPALSLRAGEPLTALPLLDETLQLNADSNTTELSIVPELPEGLTFDTLTGRVSGTPLSPANERTHTLTVSQNGNTIERYSIPVAVDLPLPDTISWLAPGFNAEVVLADAAMPVRLAAAGDGRLFFAELQSGQIRVIDPQAGLLREPLAVVDIVTGNEKGLLGLTLDPEFLFNGYLYVHATVPPNGGSDVEHAEIICYSVVENRGVNPVVIVDNLPIADLHNGGDIVFDHHGHLFVGRGDITEPERSQTEGDPAGRVLRYTKDGGIPADNPLPGDPEWARGLRNTFALAVHPHTGDLFGADAGPTDDDKLNYLVAGKNFLWGMEDEPQGSNIGFSVRIWPEVITPTGLLFHSGNGGFNDYQHELFTTSYNAEDIR
ncbi:MAG: PQQ-dependent sugar dehydrogenase, partial [Pseudomonadota bacterium]